jgi:hypothetical protein
MGDHVPAQEALSGTDPGGTARLDTTAEQRMASKRRPSRWNNATAVATGEVRQLTKSAIRERAVTGVVGPGEDRTSLGQAVK